LVKQADQAVTFKGNRQVEKLRKAQPRQDRPNGDGEKMRVFTLKAGQSFQNFSEWKKLGKRGYDCLGGRGFVATAKRFQAHGQILGMAKGKLLPATPKERQHRHPPSQLTQPLVHAAGLRRPKQPGPNT
jgi:hypothetical protein